MICVSHLIPVVNQISCVALAAALKLCEAHLSRKFIWK